MKSRSLFYLFQVSKQLLSSYYGPKALLGAIYDKSKKNYILGDEKEM